VFFRVDDIDGRHGAEGSAQEAWRVPFQAREEARFDRASRFGTGMRQAAVMFVFGFAALK